MLLKFRLAEDELFRAYEPNPIDFLAVTDFPLLWRANLYIDEGLADWNNLNRWTYAQGNEWDKDWEDADNDGIIDEAGPYNGGQCVIRPWTSIYTYFNLNLGPLQVNNALPYSFGCDNTPQYFNSRMIDQKNAIKQYYKPANNITVAPNPAPDWNNRIWQNWNDTFAPEGEWGNYIHANQDANTTTYNITVQNEALVYPYAPGFSSFRKIFNFVNNPANSGIADYSPDYLQSHTMYSSGVECQGLVARAGGYEGNSYTMTSPLEEDGLTWNHTTGTGLIGLETPANWLNIAWPITNTEDTQTSLVVPGDIIIINGHMGIVYKITYAPNTRISQKDQNQIQILEAYGTTMTVHNQRTWLDFYNYAKGNFPANPFCQILRLKVQ